MTRNLFLMLCAIAFILSSGCSREEPITAGANLAKVTIATTKSDISSLVYLAADREYFEENGLDVSLPQSMLPVMENETRLKLGRQPGTGSRMSNFLDHINFDGLKQVRPKAVTIIH